MRCRGDNYVDSRRGSVAVDLTYDASNRRATVMLPNGIVGTYGFDDADQLLSIVYDRGTTHVGDVTYNYDLAGRRIGQGGSLAKVLMPTTVNTAVYDAANWLRTWGANSLSYDDNGNLTSLGSATYGWNARNELASTTGGASAFAYDVFGRRTSRTVNGIMTPYVHDGWNPVIAGSDLMLDGLGLDEIYAQISSSGVTSFVSDALGSTRLLSDGSGNATTAYSYAPYGAAAKTSSEDTSFQFTGRENDGAACLYYYRARYYSPQLGRFVSEDPIGLNDGFNLYSYVAGDPSDRMAAIVNSGGSELSQEAALARDVEVGADIARNDDSSAAARLDPCGNKKDVETAQGRKWKRVDQKGLMQMR